MSGLSIAPYFPFRRIKIVHQLVDPQAANAHIHVQPDKRFQPICHACGHKATEVHSWTQRTIRDLNITSARVNVTCRYRKVFCAKCHGIHVEDLEMVHPYLRVTTRLARYVYQLCQMMTVSDVADHLGLDWKTVKAIDQYYLERDFGQPNHDDLRILAVDEISLRKGHNYLTVVLDFLSGRVLFVGKDRKSTTLEHFFDQLSRNQRECIEAVAMDMWDPFIKAVKKNCPRQRSYSIRFMWWPTSAVSSTKSAAASIARHVPRTSLFLKEPSTCC